MVGLREIKYTAEYFMRCFQFIIYFFIVLRHGIQTNRYFEILEFFSLLLVGLRAAARL